MYATSCVCWILYPKSQGLALTFDVGVENASISLCQPDAPIRDKRTTVIAGGVIPGAIALIVFLARMISLYTSETRAALWEAEPCGEPGPVWAVWGTRPCGSR